MKARIFPCLFNLCLIFSFFAVQAVFAQAKLYGTIGANNLFAPADDGKLSLPTRPRLVKDEKESREAKTAAGIDGLEHRVFELVNEIRTKAGLAPLVWNWRVAVVARVHSENMANLNFFSHSGQDGKRVNDRADAAGLRRWRSIGENIAYNRGFKSPLESAVQSWMNSPGHRDNILKNDWQESGIGVTVKPDGTYYFTQVFLRN